jgi:hypothetical protein
MSTWLWITLIYWVASRLAVRRVPVRVRIADRRPARARSGPPSPRHI